MVRIFLRSTSRTTPAEPAAELRAISVETVCHAVDMETADMNIAISATGMRKWRLRSRRGLAGKMGADFGSSFGFNS